MLIYLSNDEKNGMLVDHTNIFVQKKTIENFSTSDTTYVTVYVGDGVNNRELGLEELYMAQCEKLPSSKFISCKKFKNVKEADDYIINIQKSINDQIRNKPNNESKELVSDLLDLCQENKDILIALRTIGTEQLKELISLTELLKPKPKAPRKKKEDKNANMD